MTAATAIAARIAELDRAYWTTGCSPVSDAEYDALKFKDAKEVAA